MKNLLIKEWKLAIHPTVLLFFGLALMLLIPSYPFYVVFFYTVLGLFFVCVTGRENKDIEYTLTLPIRKRDAVRSRILFAMLVELCQCVMVALVVFLRNALQIGPNEAGMDANVALFGLSLIMLGLFNHLFFIRYYRNPLKVGKAFAFSAIMTFVYILFAEASTFIFPFFQNRLDTPDPLFMPEKLVTLAVGLLLFLLLSWDACRKAEQSFEALDF
ncbi:MAG: ABC-2 transporter permease [Eubacteriales bacterium]|nr:ABC-2 transporter permease [Eubacteriales bacterium]